MDNGQGGSIGRPIGSLDVVQQVARSIGADRKLRQCPQMHEACVADAKATEHGHLPGRGNRQYFGFGKSKVAGIGGIRGTDEDCLWTALPGGGVDGRAWIGSKTSGRKDSAAKGQFAKGWHNTVSPLLTYRVCNHHREK